MKAGHDGFACASCTDFFGLFLLACRLASARVLVMWDGYVERPWDLDSDSARRERCARRRVRSHEDQGDLW